MFNQFTIQILLKDWCRVVGAVWNKISLFKGGKNAVILDYRFELYSCSMLMFIIWLLFYTLKFKLLLALISRTREDRDCHHFTLLWTCSVGGDLTAIVDSLSKPVIDVNWEEWWQADIQFFVYQLNSSHPKPESCSRKLRVNLWIYLSWSQCYGRMTKCPHWDIPLIKISTNC